MAHNTTAVNAKTDTALDGHSIAFDEKSSQQPSLASWNSAHSEDRVANQRQKEEGHVTKTDADGTEPAEARHPNVQDASEIPNGGLWAWLQVLGGFFLLFNSW
jgi:hypothetical protein